MKKSKFSYLKSGDEVVINTMSGFVVKVIERITKDTVYINDFEYYDKYTGRQITSSTTPNFLSTLPKKDLEFLTQGIQTESEYMRSLLEELVNVAENSVPLNFIKDLSLVIAKASKFIKEGK